MKKYDDAIKLLDEAILLDNSRWEIHYEKALAYYQMNKFDSVISILIPFIDREDLNDNYYQILGSSLDVQKEYDSALVVYQMGLKKFPNSGKILMELGIHNIETENPVEALAAWEIGVKVEPAYDLNYYMLSKYYFHTGELFWTIMYGELFLNLSSTTGRLNDISNFINNAYSAGFYKLREDSTTGIEFTKINILSKNLKERDDLPFELAYQIMMKEASEGLLPKEKNALSIDVIHKIRTKFIEIWYKDKWNEKYSNALFDLHRKMVLAGHFETYNYWVFNAARKVEAEKWLKNNPEKLNLFGDYMIKNQLKLHKGNYINRAKYIRN
jgi:tetratricopeptide (TPR) repeat protein